MQVTEEGDTSVELVQAGLTADVTCCTTVTEETDRCAVLVFASVLGDGAKTTLEGLARLESAVVDTPENCGDPTGVTLYAGRLDLML